MKFLLATSEHEFNLLHFLKHLSFPAEKMELLLKWEDILFSILVAALVSILIYFSAKKRELIPYGLQNGMEYIVENLRYVTTSILGKEGDKQLPFLGTLFMYIFIMNIFGLIPFMKSPSSSINISAGMAIVVFVYVQYLNFKNMGVKGYLYHMAGSPDNLVSWLVVPLMFPIELLTQLTRPLTLALRLTGNIFGEHTLIAISALFAVTVFSFTWLPFGLPIQLPAMLFGILTSFMQALVFTLLSTIYILLSMPHKHETH